MPFQTRCVGRISSKRMSIAFSPPMKMKAPMPSRYWMPDDLVVGAEAEVAADPAVSFSRSDGGWPSMRWTG